MSTNTQAAMVAILQGVNLNDSRMDTQTLQAIVDAQKQGRLKGPLTDWFATQQWNQGKFSARAKFVVNTGSKAKVKISCLGDNFQAWHLSSVEEYIPTEELTYFILENAMDDSEIIAKLGGVAKSITSLGEIYLRMEHQPHGPKSPAGDMLTDGSANIFYVPQAVDKVDDNHFSYVGSDGQTTKIIHEELKDSQCLFKVGDQWFVLRAVRVFWHVDGWYVLAFSVEFPYGWYAGSRVFSRNSLKSSVPQEKAVS